MQFLYLFFYFQLSEAIGYLHDQHISHRDLKLENLLLDSNDNIKITDFGFTKHDPLSTLSNTYCGSKSYAAPEILIGEPYDPRKADIWAMGAVVYIMSTGKMPFSENKGIKKIIEEQQKLEFPWPKFQLSEECENLIKYLFTFEPVDRPTINELLCCKWLQMDK